jgi:hypothetical protein
MKVILNTNLVPMFSGTYESLWDIYECDDDGNELMVEYEHEELMKSIASAYRDHEAQILKDLNCKFLRRIHFTGDTYSPREYNFSTDELDFEADVNMAELLRTVKSLEDNAKFQEFLHEHYTSYDGFMSFTPNNYRDFRDAIVKHGDDFEQALGSLIRFKAGEETEPCEFVSIEETVHEDWQGNGYGGLDYKIVEE